MKFNYFNKKAFTLVELLVYVGLVAAIGTFIVSSALKQQKNNKASNQLSVLSIIDKEVSNFASAATITAFNDNINTENLINSNIIPAQYVQGNSIINEFGGEIIITGVASPTEKLYNMRVTNLDQYACTTASIIQGNKSYGLIINGNTVKENDANGYVNEMNVADLCSNSSNDIILTKRVLIPNLQIANTPQGVDGEYHPELFGDFVASLDSSASCPANSVNNGYSCSCEQNFIWNGAECVRSSVRFRAPGTTLGGNKNMEDFIAGTIEGTPDSWNPITKTYVPSFLNNNETRDNNLITTNFAECANGSTFNATTQSCDSLVSSIKTFITDSNPGGQEGKIDFAGCTNGLVWDQASSSCVTTSMRLYENGVEETINRDTVFNGVFHKTCNNGNLVGNRCNPLDDSAQNFPNDPDNHKKTVQLDPDSSNTLGACINGHVRNSSGTCSCPSGYTFENNRCNSPNVVNISSNDNR